MYHLFQILNIIFKQARRIVQNRILEYVVQRFIDTVHQYGQQMPFLLYPTGVPAVQQAVEQAVEIERKKASDC